MTPIKLMQKSRENAIIHIRLLLNTYNITYEEIFEDIEEDKFLKALEEAIKYKDY